MESQFIIDTSLFTQAYRTFYAFDLVPSFWNYISDLAKRKAIISIDKVLDEINRGKDDLSNWVTEEIPEGTFIKTDNSTEILEAYSELMNWCIDHKQYDNGAKSEFAKYEVADAWVIASAKVYGFTVVSQEVYSKEIKRKIPIPNVCKEFDIEHIDIYTFMRRCSIKI